MTLTFSPTDLLTLDPGKDDLLGDAGVDWLGQLEVDRRHNGHQHWLQITGYLKNKFFQVVKTQKNISYYVIAILNVITIHMFKNSTDYATDDVLIVIVAKLRMKKETGKAKTTLLEK
jgi:hypothetical protein